MTEELKQAAQQALEALRRAVPKDAEQARQQTEAITAMSRALTTSQPAQAVERGVVLPAGWVPLTIEHEPGFPEEVAFGPQRMMDRLKKWLDKHFAALAAQPAQAGEVGANCKTCNGHGLVGGHMQDGSGYGEGCPDCNPEPAPLVKWASTQPAAQAEAHPLASRCYTMSESHLSGHRLILGFETMEAAQAAHTWVANLGKPAAQATPEPDTCRKRPRCGRADPCAWLEKQATQQAAREPVGEVVYQYQIANGSWIDQTKESHDYNVKRGQATVRVLYTHPAPGVPEVDYQALIHAAWGKHKYAQGTGGCIAFKRGAEWFRDIALAAAQAKGADHV